MKKIKLTNLERLEQKEMYEVKGGGIIPHISHEQTATGDACWCIGFCSHSNNNVWNSRKQHVNNKSKNRSHRK